MKRSCAIGCAVLLVLLAIGAGIVMMKGPQWFARGKSYVMGVMAEETRISAFEAGWAPKSAKPDASWAPPTIGEWKLKVSEPVPGWPEMKINRAGQRIVYENGAKSIEIGVVAANDLEKVELLKRLTEAAEASGTTAARKTFGSGTSSSGSMTITSNSGHMTSSMGNRSHVKAGENHLRTWWLKDWLFFFRAEGAADSETFPEEYLTAIAAPTPGDAPVAPPVEKEAPRVP